MIHTLARLIVESVLEEANHALTQAPMEGFKHVMVTKYTQSVKLAQGFRLEPDSNTSNKSVVYIKFPDNTDQKVIAQLTQQINAIHQTISKDLQQKGFTLKQTNDRNSVILVSPETGLQFHQVYKPGLTSSRDQQGRYEYAMPIFMIYEDHNFKRNQQAQQAKAQASNQYAQASGQSQIDQKKTSSSLGPMRRPGALN